ncbi:lectin [Paucibacter sp. B51]|uniref:lectin n=1 Tax=Paucibacter sp. B51 TaxID=2993315 RepID=UPI0022EBFFB3|nr:lectin [Paucibacter sp. B51]
MSPQHPRRSIVCSLSAFALLAAPVAPAWAAEPRDRGVELKTVELRSSGRYESLRLDEGVRDVELDHQISGACRFNRSWGFDLSNRELWVNDGCSARFKLFGDAINGEDGGKESSGISTGAVVAGVAAVAAIALLASKSGKDKDNNSNNNDGDWQGPDRPQWGSGQIRGKDGLCLDMSGRVERGTEAIVFNCHGGNNQRFTWSNRGELRVGGMCLDVAEGNREDGARVIAWPCSGGVNQRWTRQGSEIRSRMNGKCLDIKEGRARPKQPVLLWSCNGGSNQRWSW